MPDRATFLQRQPAFTILLNAYFGHGKTLQALSFPKCYVISCDPAGLETLRQPKNDRFLKNLIWYEELHNESAADLRSLFRENAKSDERQSIYGCMAHAKEMAAKGEIESLVIDGFTYFVDMKWQAINEFEEVKSGTTGNTDSQAMYRNLGLYLQRFVASDLLTMATRQGLNVVLTCHLKRESKETVEGSDKVKNRAKKVMLNSDIAPMIEGGMRNKIEGLVGASLYLDKRLNEGKPYYEAICDIAPGLSTIVLAKNRYGLPQKLNLTDKSLYEELISRLQTSTPTAMATKAAAPLTTK